MKDRGFRNEALASALTRAVNGEQNSLYDLLCRASGLPGPRANLALVDAFGVECGGMGPKGDQLARTLATIDPDRAPGGTELEILPMCGVMAIGVRAAADDRAASKCLKLLHDAAEDLRFRVRDCVPTALALSGEARPNETLVAVAPWMDGFFQAAAVLRALALPRWMTKISDAALVVTRMEEGFGLLRTAERAAARYPGHKALVEALSATPAAMATRFGVPVFDMLAGWSTVADPDLREVVAHNLKGDRMTGRFAQEVARVRAVLDASSPKRRDPKTYVGRTRGRGRKHDAR